MSYNGVRASGLSSREELSITMGATVFCFLIYLIYLNSCHAHITGGTLTERFTVATIALFSASEQTHFALAVCDSERVTAALRSEVFLISTEVAYLQRCLVVI